MISNEKVAESSTQKFYCSYCDYYTCKKYNYDKHNLTAKHIKSMNSNEKVAKSSHTIKHVCKTCLKEYKDYSGLWRHKKKCPLPAAPATPNHNADDMLTKDHIIMMLIKQNSELIKETTEVKSMIMEVLKNATAHQTINNNTNCHNKSFNLNLFLNEKCKDAMNIMDFVESIKLQLSDLENVGKAGFVNGISNIIVKNLKALDETQRPVHCTDKKREVIYVKDEDKWEKEDAEYKKVRKAIKTIAKKNSKLLFEFKEKHPDCVDGDSKHSETYSKLVVEAYGGANKEDAENESRIIKNISKEVLIPK
jgi:hypothetical protein